MHINLAFLSCPGGPELLHIVFTCDTIRRECSRGSPVTSKDGRGAFRWSAAVQALALLLTHHAVAELEGRPRGTLEGDKGSHAASLDYAISKEPVWLLDMFGTTARGDAFINRIVERENSERRRPGPVVLKVRSEALAPTDVKIHLDGAPLEGKQQLLDFCGILRRALSVSSEGDDPGYLSGMLEKLVIDGDAFLRTLNLQSYVRDLRADLKLLADRPEQGCIIEYIKKQIKEVCIMSEAHYASTLGGLAADEPFLFSCSSLIDAGVEAYVSDPHWQYLLFRFGSAFKVRGKVPPLRIFFVNSETLWQTNLHHIDHIIRQHLACGINVKLVPDEAVVQAARDKRNMAIFGHKVLLHATDQVSWDLDLTVEMSALRAAKDKHFYFQSLDGCHIKATTRDPLALVAEFSRTML